MKLRDAGFLLAFTAALLPPSALVFVRLGMPVNMAAWWPLAFLFGLVPLLDALCGDERGNRELSGNDAGFLPSRYFSLLVMLTLPIWLMLLIWCEWQFGALAFGIAGQIGWIVSTGVIGGVLAINPAHELIHKSGRLEPLLGGIGLTSVGYPGFKVEHVRGHHVHVSTPHDSSSARLGESVYAFVPRALWLNMRNAWRLEAGRLRQRGRSAWSWRNEMVRWYGLWLAMMIGFVAFDGVRGLLFFLAQGLVAAITLEVINYVEHYGLERQEISPGRYQRVTHRHSWNAPQRYTNWMLFNLQRHSDHHAQPRRRYHALQHHEDSPRLPAGYATMLLLALFPPLWHHVMDPLALRQREFSA